MWDDRIWQQRIRLSNCLLLECVDWWCGSDGNFPTDEVLASVLYLFSPRCYPLGVSENGLRKSLQDIVGSPTSEYSKTWPDRDEPQCDKLLGKLAEILDTAVHQWSEGTFLDPTIEAVNQQIVDEIVEQQYVIFHHYRTTRRDLGGFHGSG